MSNGQVFVEVFEGDIKERQGAFKDDNGDMVDYHTRSQEAKLEAGAFSYPFDVRLDKGQAPFKPGRYQLRLDKMLKVNNGKASLSKFPVLEAVAAGAK